ncbi:hypothetical protein [Micromonospora sagamiensis]|uniref:Uncharacterized protein n=1 Tax=Micromonospora sagamiensis TaxID=47875 RepID=A0A562WHP8_9ACTN|nr:hypothetical protein [Micromonospora sagamiensis]TWJ29803.1 hypothetical protein JD81_03334 [Micromonospora sagamiensis]BCL17168.1 hypothetical protein GCM10017556_49070 [Micromonospora sagamiensis]
MTAVRERAIRRSPLTRIVATILAAVTLTLGLTVVANVTTAAPAQALCSTPAITGNWSNIDAASSGVVRVEIRFTCSDTVVCDAETGVCTRPPSTLDIRPFGACSPTACDWGWRTTTAMGDGWVRALYHHSWATKDVWARTEVWHGQTFLRVWIYTDYTDGRTDRETNEWFLK